MVNALAIIAAISAWSGAAHAALVQYQFTATFNFTQFPSAALPADSFAARGAALPAISGVISYETSVVANPGSSPDNASYNTPVTISLDQFSTINPSSPTNRLTVINDPALYSTYTFRARDSDFGVNPNPYSDAIWFRFEAENGIFSTLEIPTTLSLNDFIFGTVTLVTRDNAANSTNLANFLITSLTPVEEVPIPATPFLFASGLGALALLRRSRKRNQSA